MKLILLLLAAAVFGLAGAANAATFNGTFYDVAGVQDGGPNVINTMTKADNFLAGMPGADATFDSTGINYGNPSPFNLSDLGTFLAADAGSLSSNAGTSFLGSIITLTGHILLQAGVNTFDIFSDDGFSLLVGGTEIGRFESLRAPASSIINHNAGLGGVVAFELRYFEGSLTQAALIGKLNGHILTAVAPIPVPATLPMIIGGLVVLGGLRKRRKQRQA